MGYTETLLAQGEVIARRGKQHWLALLLDSRTALGVWLLAIVLLAASVFFDFDPNARTIVGYVVLVLLVIGLVLFLYRLLRWLNNDYLVTNRRIIKVEGILNKRSMDSSLEKINDLVLDENILGRMLGYGDLDVVTASDVAIDRFRMLNDAKEFKRTMLDQKHRLEYGEDMRLPGPPLMADRGHAAEPTAQPVPAASAGPALAPPSTRESEPVQTSAPSSGDGSSASSAADATSTAGSAAGGVSEALPVADPVAPDSTMEPVTMPEQPVARRDEGDDPTSVTQTLARLADLRDRGAISVEDYDQKKTELLGRL